jgi:hypothetical protein
VSPYGLTNGQFNQILVHQKKENPRFRGSFFDGLEAPVVIHEIISSDRKGWFHSDSDLPMAELLCLPPYALRFPQVEKELFSHRELNPKDLCCL